MHRPKGARKQRKKERGLCVCGDAHTRSHVRAHAEDVLVHRRRKGPGIAAQMHALRTMRAYGVHLSRLGSVSHNDTSMTPENIASSTETHLANLHRRLAEGG